MPYVTTTRSIPAPNAIPSAGSARVYRRCGSFIRNFGGAQKVIEIPLYTRSGSLAAGSQTTWSWRTGKGAIAAGIEDRTLTGPELRRLLYNGYDFDVDNATTLGVQDNGLSQWDKGHEFSTTKRLDTAFYEDVSGLPAIVASRVVGGATETLVLDRGVGVNISTGNVSAAPPIGALSKSWRLAQGSSLYEAAMPKAPGANLTQLVAEFVSDGPMALLSSAVYARAKYRKSNSTKAIGSDYLAYQFGWVPTVSDVRKIIGSLLNMTEIISQFDRDYGRVVRRKRTARPVRENKVVWQGKPSLGLQCYQPYGSSSFQTFDLTDWLHSGSADAVVIDEIETASKFSGAFSYGHPLGNKGEKVASFAERANHLLGLKLTPELLWELAPWSWLIDWFTNVGDCISIISAQSDGLTCRYGYVMNSYESERTIMVSGLKIGETNVPAFLARKATYKAAYRDRSTPFGFGLSLGALTEYQWSILAALGMTKGGRNLRLAEYS